MRKGSGSVYDITWHPENPYKRSIFVYMVYIRYIVVFVLFNYNIHLLSFDDNK
jgi:hypothetical protein